MTEIAYPDLIRFCDALQEGSGHAFHEYAKSSLKRRILRILNNYRSPLDQLIAELRSNPELAGTVAGELTVNVTEMFRDPAFYQSLQTTVVPELHAAPDLKIWSAGCSSGEELYSLVLLFAAHGLIEKSFFQGTDLNAKMVERARNGKISQASWDKFLNSYLLSGIPGDNSVETSFNPVQDGFMMKNELLERCQFETGNLIENQSGETFDLILCRNVLIYFDLNLQNKVLNSLYHSLKPGGFLCLGEKETLRFSGIYGRFREVDHHQKIYRKDG